MSAEVNPVVIEQKGKVGLADPVTEKVILKPKYAHISDFVDGHAVARKTNGKEGVITTTGREEFGCDYEAVLLPLMYYNGLPAVWAKKAGRWQLRSKMASDGTWINYDYNFSELHATPAGFVGYQDGGKTGWYRVMQHGEKENGRISSEFLSADREFPGKELSATLYKLGSSIYDRSGKELYSAVTGYDELRPAGYIRLHAPSRTYNNDAVDTSTGRLLSKDKKIVGDRVCKIEENIANRNIYICSFSENGGPTSMAVVANNGNVLLPFDSIPVAITVKKAGADEVVRFDTRRDLAPYIPDILLGNPTNRWEWDNVVKGSDYTYVVVTDANGTAIYHTFYDGPFVPVTQGTFSSVEKIDGGWNVTESGRTYNIDNSDAEIKGGALYDRIIPCDDRYSYVVKDGKYGLLNTASGELAIPLKYKLILQKSWLRPDEFEVRTDDGKFGHYSVGEQRFTLPIGACDAVVHNIGSDMLIVEKDDKYGAISHGKWVVPIRHTGFGGWNERHDKLFFDDENQYRTGLTFYVYTFDGKLITKQFFYNDQRRQYKQWMQRWYQ